MFEVLQKMTVGELLGSFGGILIILATVIQIAPIKLNPWSHIARAIGRAINKEIYDKVDSFEKGIAEKVDNFGDDVKELREMIQEGKDIADMREAKAIRLRILRFGDEILHGVQHSKDHFDEVLLCITEYTQYCDGHKNFANHVTDSTIDLIMRTYKKCLSENKFL